MAVTLTVGSTGDKVRRLQEALRRENLPAPSNGIYDRETELAVRAFQRREGLSPENGVAGPATIAALALDPDTLEDRVVIGQTYADLQDANARSRIRDFVSALQWLHQSSIDSAQNSMTGFWAFATSASVADTEGDFFGAWLKGVFKVALDTVKDIPGIGQAAQIVKIAKDVFEPLLAEADRVAEARRGVKLRDWFADQRVLLERFQNSFPEQKLLDDIALDYTLEDDPQRQQAYLRELERQSAALRRERQHREELYGQLILLDLFERWISSSFRDVNHPETGGYVQVAFDTDGPGAWEVKKIRIRGDGGDQAFDAINSILRNQLRRDDGRSVRPELADPPFALGLKVHKRIGFGAEDTNLQETFDTFNTPFPMRDQAERHWREYGAWFDAEGGRLTDPLNAAAKARMTRALDASGKLTAASVRQLGT